MADTELYLTGARLLANALSLPKQMQAADQEAAMQQALFQLAQGQQVSPETMQAFQPPQGTAGKILSGIGDVGAVLSGVLGAPVRAPRLDTNALATITAQNQKQQANSEIAGQYKHPRAQALARLGRFSEAEAVERGGGGKGTSELSVLMQAGLDQGMDEPAARRWALEQLQTRYKERAGFQGGISRQNTLVSQGNQDVIQDTNRAEVRGRGADYERANPLPSGRPPVRTVPPGGVIPQSGSGAMDGGFTLIGDMTAPDGSGGYTLKSRTRTSEGEIRDTMGNPLIDKRGEDFFNMAASLDPPVDPYTQDPAEIARVTAALRAAPAAGQLAKERATMVGKAAPLVSQLGRVKQAITAKGLDGQPLLVSKAATGGVNGGFGGVLQTGAATMWNQQSRLRGLQQAGDPNLKTLELFDANMAGLAKALGDSGNISDTAINLLSKLATGFAGKTQEDAMATAVELENVLNAIAGGAPWTMRDPARGAQQNQIILQSFMGSEEAPSGAVDLGDGFTLEPR